MTCPPNVPHRARLAVLIGAASIYAPGVASAQSAPVPSVGPARTAPCVTLGCAPVRPQPDSQPHAGEAGMADRTRAAAGVAGMRQGVTATVDTAAQPVASRHAAHAPLVSPDRPGFSFTPGTMPSGALQLEVGATDQHAGSLTYRTVGETLLRVGVSATTELRVSGQSYASRHDGAAVQPAGPTPTSHGTEDARIGVKQRLLAAHADVGLAATSVALIAGSTLPTGSRGFGAHAWQPEAVLTINTPVTQHLSLVENVSDSWAAPTTTPHGERAHRLGGTVAGWYTLGHQWSVFGEYAESRVAGVAATTTQYLDAGVTFVPVGHVQLDVRAGAGLNGIRGDHFVGAGIVRRW